jgi:RNA polymerase sigma-70 factor (ECF subfamily)
MDHLDAHASLDDRRQIEAWIDEAKQGSSEALGKLLEASHLHLLAMARRRTSKVLQCKVSPSDLVQETSLAAHRGFALFRGQRLEELLAWLREILLHQAANVRRSYQETGKRDLALEFPINGNPFIEHNLPAADLSPRAQLVVDEERELIERAMERLGEDHRRVIELRSRERLSFIEIGERMERSADAARKLWLRAVERLERECDHGQG